MSKPHLVTCFCLSLTLSVAAASAQVPTQNDKALNPEVMALQNSADLVVRGLAFTALGEVTFDLVNRGAVGVNLPTQGLKASGGRQPSGPPIQLEVWMGNAKVVIQQPAMGGKQTKSITVPLPSNVAKPKCLESRSLKVRVDPQNAISELYDNNNETVVDAAERPCPDLAVVSIERDKEGVLGEMFRAKVTIINQGNAASPGTKVWGTSMASAPGLTSWPELNPTHDLKPLQPGEKTSFKIGGSTLSSDVLYVRIILDRFFQIDESDESNNFKEKKI